MAEDKPTGVPGGILKSTKDGWDGKLRIGKAAELHKSPDTDDEHDSDEEPPAFQPEVIDADEDLLEDYPEDTDDIDLVHRRISSIPALNLGRFKKVVKLCLRQNAITRIELPDCIGATVTDLDLYDNLIGHLKGLENVHHLTSLDLSFNKLKHIKNIEHLTELRDLYFVQNRISAIEGLETLTKLRNLELAANRIREIENLEQLTSLEELWLGRNKLTEIKNLSPLTNLRILSLPSNRLTTLSGLGSLTSLSELHISHNALTSLEGLEANTHLTILEVSNNRLAHLSHLETLTDLEEFWASNNQLASFQEVERELKDKAKLETVYFEGNPLQTKDATGYRRKVRLALPEIKQIDASTYSPRSSGEEKRGLMREREEVESPN